MMPMLVERSITKPAMKKNCSNQGAMSLPRPSPSALTKSRLASGNPLAPMVEKTSTQRATSKRAPINQKVMRCSVFATFHHAMKRRSFSSVEGGTYPRGGDAVRDVDAHAHPLIPNVLALAEVVGPTRAREGYRPHDGESPDLLPVGGEIGEALRSLGDDAPPGRQIGGDEYRKRDEGQDDDHQHGLDLLEDLVDHRREGYRRGDGDEEYRGDDGYGALAQAEDEREQLGAAGGPPWDGVR